MTEKTENILSLNHTEAMDFFLKSEQYHGFELPEYFVFDDCYKIFELSNKGATLASPRECYI